MTLPLHEVHSALGARFTLLNGHEAVAHYANPAAEHHAIRSTAGVLDLGFRGRFCLTGSDRSRLLHGQVTNDVQSLQPFQGCYAAFVSNKGRIQADAFIHALAQELLVDVEPGLTDPLLKRLDHYIVADDVQCTDVTPFYGLLSVQGPRALQVVQRLDLPGPVPQTPLHTLPFSDPSLGDLYIVRNPRTGSDGIDLFVPLAAQPMILDRLAAAARDESGSLAGWQAFDAARIEAGIPRFGIDMDESNLAPEAGIEARAISYSKGCYIGQETIARIRTYGQVSKALRGLRLDETPGQLPNRGEKLFRDGREVGYLTSVLRSETAGGVIALGYVRRECNAPGTELLVRTAAGDVAARIVPLPFA